MRLMTMPTSASGSRQNRPPLRGSFGGGVIAVAMAGANLLGNENHVAIIGQLEGHARW
jgi:hypothetical protein